MRSSSHRWKCITALVLAASIASCKRDAVAPVVGAISGKVLIENVPASGLTVSLSLGRSTTTNAAGNYSFSAVEGGSHTVSIGGYGGDVTFTPSSKSVVISSSDEDVTADFAGVWVRTSSVQGSVLASGLPVAGATVSLSGLESRVATTAQNGTYSFTGLRPGSYSLQLTAPGNAEFSETSKSISLVLGESESTDFVGTALYSVIQGVVTASGTPSAGVLVSLSGAESRTTTTGPTGSYAFTALRAGNYVVALTVPNETEFDPSARPVALDVGETEISNFTGTLLFSISGSITGEAGVTIRVTGTRAKLTTTGPLGFFLVSGLPPGPYTVTPVREGAVFAPMDRPVTIASANVSSVSFDRETPQEGLSVAILTSIDAQPETRIAANEVVLPNGQTLSAYIIARGLAGPQAAIAAAGDPVVSGPQQRKNDIIALMVAHAQDLACGRNSPACTKWNFPADPLDPTNKPAQQGLTYVYGGKTLSQRTRPVDGCPEMTYGVDCSGLISVIAQRAGISSPDGSAAQADPANWLFPASWKLKFKKITDGAFQTGDIVAWPGHIGIAQSTGTTGSVAVISSTGAPGQCLKNVSPPRGPRSLTIPQLGLGAPTSVLRLVTTLSGTFDLYMRCIGQSTDAAIIRFSINNENGGPFQATGNGVDYDGTPFTAVLTGTYNQTTNTVQASLAIPSFFREDSFIQTLLEDDTGYFALTKVLDNGGCFGSVRLVRVADPSGAPPALRAPAGVVGGARLGGPRR